MGNGSCIASTRTSATGTGGNLRFDPECEGGGAFLLVLESALVDFAFELERPSFSCHSQ